MWLGQICSCGLNLLSNICYDESVGWKEIRLLRRGKLIFSFIIFIFIILDASSRNGESTNTFVKKVAEMIENFTSSFIQNKLDATKLAADLEPILNSDSPISEAIKILMKITLSNEEKVEALIHRLPKPRNDRDQREFYRSIAFIMENLHRKRDLMTQTQNISSDSRFCAYAVTQYNLFNVKDFQYYADFNVENFVKEMVEQSTPGAKMPEYYQTVGDALKKMYSIATGDKKANQKPTF